MCCRKLSCLFRGRHKEVLAVVILALGVDLAVIADDPITLLLPEGRIGQDHIEGLAAGAEQRVTGLDGTLAAGDVVQVKVHRA